MLGVIPSKAQILLKRNMHCSLVCLRSRNVTTSGNSDMTCVKIPPTEFLTPNLIPQAYSSHSRPPTTTAIELYSNANELHTTTHEFETMN
jgi:hypothetical protein